MLTEKQRKALEYIRDNDACGVMAVAFAVYGVDRPFGRSTPSVVGQLVGKLRAKGLVRKTGIGGEDPVSYFITPKGIQSICEE